MQSADYVWLFPCIENQSNTPRYTSYSALHNYQTGQVRREKMNLNHTSTGKCRKEHHVSNWFKLLSFKLLRVPVLWKPSMTNEINLHISLASSLNGCHAKSEHSETAGAELRRLWAVCKSRPTSASWPTCRLPTVHFTPCALRTAKCFHTRKAGPSKILNWLCKWRPCNLTVAHSVHKVMSRLLHLFDLLWLSLNMCWFFKSRKFITSAAAYTQRFCIGGVIKVNKLPLVLLLPYILNKKSQHIATPVWHYSSQAGIASSELQIQCPEKHRLTSQKEPIDLTVSPICQDVSPYM